MPPEQVSEFKPGGRGGGWVTSGSSLDWAQLHQRTSGTDVLQCPCGGMLPGEYLMGVIAE